MNEKANHRRGRTAPLGLLMVLVLALAAVGYRHTFSPSASTGSGASASGAGSQVVLAPAASNNGNGNCVATSNGNGSCDKSLGVTVGQAQTLYPGLSRSLPVTFSNSNQFDIYVDTYRVSVTVPAAKAGTCPASNLLVPSGAVTLNPNLKVTAKGSATTTVPIKLAATAPEGCQLVTFTITVSATAVKK